MKLIFRYFDIKLFTVITVLISHSIIIISSVTGSGDKFFTTEVKTQMFGVILGLIFLIISMFYNYKELETYIIPIYGISIFLLLLVFVPGLGSEQFGGRSWIKIGSRLYFQTSELSKIGFIIFFASYFDPKKRSFNKLIEILEPIVIALPFFILIFLQNDLGTLLVFMSIFTGMFFISGLNLKIVLGSIFSVILASPFVYKVLKGHAKDRIKGFLNPEDLSIKSNYHVYMSKITMGTGGLRGKGLFNAEFSGAHFLPVQTSDFIFPVVVEELGFIGGIFIMLLYFYLLFRLIIISFGVRDTFGSNIIIGILFMFAFQIFENIGMTMGMLPITGITLPFLSYGGSSMLTSLMSISLVMNIYMRRFRKKGI
ncbi:MAG: rod shape-determining protein RodA [Clostridiales bacterium]|nr:MAG: rod shape-determining protein RodA [Clostridiales bacterium]